jgi:hypothetical protein
LLLVFSHSSEALACLVHVFAILLTWTPWRDQKIEHLKMLIAKLRRMQLGPLSEKLDHEIEQLELRLDELQSTPAENTASNASVATPVANSTAKPARRPLPEH